MAESDDVRALLTLALDGTRRADIDEIRAYPDHPQWPSCDELIERVIAGSIDATTAMRMIRSYNGRADRDEPTPTQRLTQVLRMAGAVPEIEGP